MKKTIISTLLVLVFLTSNVSADYGSCTDQDIQYFRECIGWNTWDQYWHIYAYCQWTADLNDDLVVNLSDVALFAQSCWA